MSFYGVFNVKMFYRYIIKLVLHLYQVGGGRFNILSSLGEVYMSFYMCTCEITIHR